MNSTPAPASDADWLALHRLCVTYAQAVDLGEWDRLDEVFVDGAVIDYSATGGAVTSHPEVKGWLRKNLRHFRSTTHQIGNVDVEVAGDEATGVVTCFNPMVIRNLLGGQTTVMYGLRYHDRYQRTEAGWRISERRIELAYTAGIPLWMRLATALMRRRQRRAAA